MNIHGARRAGRRRRKACMGWSWAAACGVQRRGHIVRPRAQLVTIVTLICFVAYMQSKQKLCTSNLPVQYGRLVLLSYTTVSPFLLLTSGSVTVQHFMLPV